MSNPHPDVVGLPPAAAAAAAHAVTGDDVPDVPSEDRATTHDGVPVGAADAEEDVITLGLCTLAARVVRTAE